jgi:AraC family transcriptional regulator
MARCIREERFSSVRGILGASSFVEDANPNFAEWVRSAQEYISEHLADPGLSSQQIALHTGLSPRHLNRLFKQEMNMPLFQYVQQKRLEKARTLLENPAISIQQTAQYCGFRQPSHFSAWFTRHMKRSPRAYRADNKQ